jgi:hypothetical protein
MIDRRMRLLAYAAAAESTSGAERGVARLGVACCVAAGVGRLVRAPEEWGWPRLVEPEEPVEG